MKLTCSTIALTVLLSIALLPATDDKPRSNPRFDYNVARTHEIDPHGYIHTIHIAGMREGYSRQLHLTLTVSPTGDVVAAEAAGDPESLQFWPKVEDTIRQWKFTPFEQNGRAVTAQVEEFVDLVSPERFPTHHVAPPALRPQSKISISLERSGCFGACPSYTVTITTNDIVFDGHSHVAAAGTQRDSVDPGDVRALAQRFIAADFYSMEPSYVAGVTDCPTYKLSIDVDGHAKEVEDYVGSWVGMPAVITELEDAVDTLAQTARWIAGEAGMVRTLRAQKFNFHTRAAQDILKEAARRGNAATVQELLDAGVPLTPLPVFDPKQRENVPPESLGWLQAAITKPQVLHVLMDAGASSNDQTDKDVALVRAVFFAQVESARALVAYGANPNADLATLSAHGGMNREETEAGTILIYAAKSQHPEVVREILRYHPRLEARDAKGRTAIFAALQYHSVEDKNSAIVECVRLLAEAGADVNARDNDGNTPLHATSFVDVAEELLRLGADVNARNNKGETPIFTTENNNVIALFIDHGADLTLRNNAGQTVMETRQEALRKAMQRVH